MTAHCTGTVLDLDGHPNLVLTRGFAAPATEVWRRFTDPEAMRPWIGYWAGHPATGRVDFFMTAEGADPPPMPFTIAVCDAPRRFAGDTSAAAGGWHLWFELDERDGMTIVTFGQRLGPEDDIGSIGPGWEYYLDRAVEAHAGRDAAAVVWDDYWPALQDEYLALVAGG